MTAKNEIKVLRELANKTDNCTASYKHLAGRILEQIKYNACSIIPYPTVEEKHI